MKKETTLIVAALLGLATASEAQKGTNLSPAEMVKTVSYGAVAESGNAKHIIPMVLSQTHADGATTIVVDISGEQSWDPLGDPNNTVLNVAIPSGAAMTGIGWDVNISTVGGSWLSEAVSYFDGSDQDLSGLFLTPGVGDNFPGSSFYSSGGTLDLTDNGIPDIPILGDGTLYIQLFDSFDDNANAVDANYTAPSSVTIVYEGGGPVIPTASEWGLIVLTALLLVGGAVLIVRRSMAQSATTTA
jgi:hypothetical protein